MVAQGYLLPGRDPVAVTAVQLIAAAVGLLPLALIAEGVPALGTDVTGLSSTVGLALLGTLAPFVLFAYGQGTVPSPVAGAFVNIEPLVGVAIAAVLMGEALGVVQGLGAAAIVAGLVLTSRDQFLQRDEVVTLADARFDLAAR
jgi:drug/metabolite transporter (DMT)-like permease